MNYANLDEAYKIPHEEKQSQENIFRYYYYCFMIWINKLLISFLSNIYNKKSEIFLKLNFNIEKYKWKIIHKANVYVNRTELLNAVIHSREPSFEEYAKNYNKNQ